MCLVPTRLNLTHSDCLNVKVGNLSDSNNQNQSNDMRKRMLLCFQWVRPSRNPNQQHNQSQADINNKRRKWWSIRPVKMILQNGSCRLSPCQAAVQAANRWGPDEAAGFYSLWETLDSIGTDRQQVQACFSGQNWANNFSINGYDSFFSFLRWLDKFM